MIIDCAYYQDGRRRDDGAASLQEAAARRSEGGFVWLGLFEPGDDELAEVRDAFGLHELAIGPLPGIEKYSRSPRSHRRPRNRSRS